MVIQIEVHLKPCPVDRLNGIGPFTDHRRIRIFFLKHLMDIAPDCCCGGFVFIIVLDQGISHVHAEAIASVIQPETHDILQCFTCCHSITGACGRHPFFRAVKPSVIQSRLRSKEVQHIGAFTFLHAADIRMISYALECIGSPDIPAAVSVRFCFAGLNKPGMLVGCMSRHKVQEHLDSSLVCLSEEFIQVFIRSITRGNLQVIPYIISGIHERGIKTRIDPEGIASKIPDIVKLLNDALQVTDPVMISIQERLRIDLIKYRIIQPFLHLFSPSHSVSTAVLYGGSVRTLFSNLTGVSLTASIPLSVWNSVLVTSTVCSLSLMFMITAAGA